jgi:uncharacterized protein YihD (DUF1040 family)
MIETEDYWIIENKFVFKPQFNESIDKYYNLIDKYDVLIFSNYDDANICIERNNLHCEQYYFKYFYSKFNQVIKLHANLTNLNFNHHFNQFVELPDTLIHLSFGWHFNQPIELVDNLTHLTFGNNFNQEVKLPLNLTHLTFGYYFNQKVNIPSKLKYLKLDMNDLYLIENLPNSIEELELNYHFDLELNNLPNSVRIIKFCKFSYYDKELNNLVDTIKILKLPMKYQKKIKNIPRGLKKIILSKDYAYIDDFKTFDIDLETY